MCFFALLYWIEARGNFGSMSVFRSSSVKSLAGQLSDISNTSRNQYGTLIDDEDHYNPPSPACTETDIIHDKFCDGCRVDPIAGRRFSCKTCDDFDLCGRCFLNLKKGCLQHDPNHTFEEQNATSLSPQDLHLTEILVRVSDVVDGIIFRRHDTSRLFYGRAGGIESDDSSLKLYLAEGEYITRQRPRPPCQPLAFLQTTPAFEISLNTLKCFEQKIWSRCPGWP